jgi:muconolactone D-isomerase
VLYLVHLTFSDPSGVSDSELDSLRQRETARAHELQRDGTLIGLWREPGQRASWAMWDVASADELDKLLRSLPYWPWMSLQVYLLSEHPNALTL